MSKSTILPALLGVAALLAPSTRAQTITWGPVMPALAATDVSLNGTLVVARNLHASGATQSPTVNGVTFVGAFAPSGWNNASTLALQGSTTGDAGYDLMLNSARATSAAATANPTGWGAIRLDTLGTFTVGRDYEIQCWYTDQRPGTGTAAIYDRVMTLSSAVGPATLVGGEVTNLGSLVQGPLSGPLEADPDNNPALSTPDTVFGSYCIGRFTRVNATDQIWLLVQGSHPNPTSLLRSNLTAFQIRESLAYHRSTGTGCYAPAPLTLAGSPAPVITLGGAGPAVPCTYTAGNVPEAVPGSGFGICLMLWSVGPLFPGGLDLGTPPVDVGMPGCSLYISSFDVILDISGPITGGAGGTLATTLAVPQPLSPGLEFHTQVLALLPPGPPGGGTNPFGGRMSNGLTAHYDIF